MKNKKWQTEIQKIVENTANKTCKKSDMAKTFCRHCYKAAGLSTMKCRTKGKRIRKCKTSQDTNTANQKRKTSQRRKYDLLNDTFLVHI